MKLIHLKNTPIFDQLLLEEGLLRTRDDNWCIINEGSPRAIIMGISGKHEELVHPSAFEQRIPVIKRFSGGGTVIADENTLFISFIFNKKAHDFPAYPEPIMRWTEALYTPIFNLKEFGVKGNDYTIGNLKCGGNAQYLRKHRWLHHTTFLWDYKASNMDYLLMPAHMPAYRKHRPHAEFVTRIADHLPSKKLFVDTLKRSLNAEEVAPPIIKTPHRISTQYILTDS